jgi:hypothetical protein
MRKKIDFLGREESRERRGGERQVSDPSSKFGSDSPRKNGPDFGQFTLFFLFTKKSEDFVFYPYTQNPSICAELAA